MGVCGMEMNEFLGKWGVFLCSVADGLMIVRATTAPLMSNGGGLAGQSAVLSGEGVWCFCGRRGADDALGAVAVCSRSAQGFGLILGMVAFYYQYTIGGSEGPTMCACCAPRRPFLCCSVADSPRRVAARRAFIAMGALMVIMGIVGVVGLAAHSWLILLVSTLATCALFIGMFALMVMAMMIGYNYTDPVKDYTVLNWKTTELELAQPLRKEAESLGICKALEGKCADFYPALQAAMASNDWAADAPAACASHTEVEFATDCLVLQSCNYDLATNRHYGCKACDTACMEDVVKSSRESMEPLAYTAFAAFFFLIAVAFFNDYLWERESFGGAEGSLFDGARDQMENIGVGVNAFNAFMGLILVVLGAIFSSETGAALFIAFLGTCLVAACSAVAVGIYMQNPLTPMLLFYGNSITVALAFVLLLAGIIAGMAAGVVTGIGEKIDDDWDDIREEMARTSPHYCAYMDDAQCKLKIQNGVQDQAVNLAWIMLVVLSFLVGKIYLTYRALSSRIHPTTRVPCHLLCGTVYSPAICPELTLRWTPRDHEVHVQIQQERAQSDVGAMMAPCLTTAERLHKLDVHQVCKVAAQSLKLESNYSKTGLGNTTMKAELLI